MFTQLWEIFKCGEARSMRELAELTMEKPENLRAQLDYLEHRGLIRPVKEEQFKLVCISELYNQKYDFIQPFAPEAAM